MLEALIVAFLWSLYPFILKYKCSNHIKPLVSWSIFTISAGVMALIVAVITKQNLFISSKDVIPIVAASFIGPVCGILLYIYLIQKYPVTLVMPLAFTTPLFAVVLGALFFNEKVTFQQILGIVAIFVGVVLLVMKNKSSQ
jgi:drug/metabolite transporter (DMT)-like permease